MHLITSSNIFNQISINDYKSFATKEKKKNEKEAISNGILEKSILYRLERALTIEAKLQEIEDKKTKEAEKNF